MPELRHDPVLDEWVIISPQRQNRTFLPPAEYCPLCPTRPGQAETEIPREDYEIAVFENLFPSLTRDAALLTPSGSHPSRPGRGVCEVVCYTPVHDTTLADLPVRQIVRLIEVWKDRYAVLGARKEVKYVLIFENKGKEIGVTLTHPHGQIYAFPFIPPRPARELRSAKIYREKNGRCLFCDIVADEMKIRSRIVVENGEFVGFIPSWAHWPYEVHLYPKRHEESIAPLSPKTIGLFADALKRLLTGYDRLFGFSLPYIMILHQAPTDGKAHPCCHFHVEFYPPYRTGKKLKYPAGCESGGWVFINDTIPEDRAAFMRKRVRQAEG